MSKVLKPCPFCGSEATIHTVEPHKHAFATWIPDYAGGTFIECNNCSCAVSGETEQEAISRWNTRKPMQEINQDENVMEKLTTELGEYICDMVCGNLDDVKNREDADRICDECKLGSFIFNICNEYNQINDFEKSQCSKLLKKISRLRQGYGDVVERLEEENKRLKKLKNGFIALSDHEVCDIENQAYNFCIEIVKEVGGMNDYCQQRTQ